MPWVVFLHIMFMSVWFGCLIALPRLLAEHAQHGRESELGQWHLMMERKLFKLAMTPAAVLTVLTGFWLLFSHGFEGGWLPVKLVFVSLMAFAHLYQARLLADLRDGINAHGVRFFHLQSLLPAAFAGTVIVLVVGKPF
jgi:protoporphyrinogen IX oxidase